MMRVHPIFSIIGILVILICVSFILGKFIRSDQRTKEMSSPVSVFSSEDRTTPTISKVQTETSDTSDTWQSFKEVNESVWEKKDRGESLTNEDYQRLLDALERDRKESARRDAIRKRIVAEINREDAERKKAREARLAESEQRSARTQSILARADAILARVIRDENGEIIGLRGSHLSPEIDNPGVSNTDTSVPSEQSDTISETTDTPLVRISENNEGWHETLETQLSSLKREIEDEYISVIVAPYLSREEFDEFFPTDASRAELKNRQQEMHADIAARVERFLAEDTGNRSEKLTIIRQTLSENWSPDIAESVLEQLDLNGVEK